MSATKNLAARFAPHVVRLGGAAILALSAMLTACGGVDDGRNCCRGVLCGYPPDKSGECVGPSGETTSYLDSDGGTGWEDDDAAVAEKTDDTTTVSAVPVQRAAPVTQLTPTDTLR